jgi:Icc-related predicted phosphoesterase
MKFFIACCFIYLLPQSVLAQAVAADSLVTTSIDFVSDTQQPLFVEKIYRKTNHNTIATAKIFSALLKDKPSALFMTGDVVSLGYSNNKWKKVDVFLDSARQEGVKVYGLLGNHDVMICDNKGERNFNKRFTEHIRTGYIEVVDSIAIILLNSNFSKLPAPERDQQQQWFIKIVDSLNNSNSIKGIIVSSHHPVYTNSTVVKPSAMLTKKFLPTFINTKKCILFITGHAHTFEHFQYQNKNFLVIGGGGGIHQKTKTKANMPADISADYKPYFHYLNIKRYGNLLELKSYFLKPDFSGFSGGYSFSINLR